MTLRIQTSIEQQRIYIADETQKKTLVQTDVQRFEFATRKSRKKNTQNTGKYKHTATKSYKPTLTYKLK